eukprot:jgi/Psemu1/235432/estExt_Genewise1.C_280167
MTMSKRPDQHSASSSEEVHEPEATEKTIPFLRRLVDMLSENEDVISFCPGYIENGEIVLGRIVVHDRVKVENQILPRYFNHSSFASLRRQLNYFSFTRIGKGRQKGATYCNEGVIVIEDILRLRRRSTTSSTSSSVTHHCSPVSTKHHHSGKMESFMTSTSFSPTRSRMKVASPRSRTKRVLSEASFQPSCFQGQEKMKKVQYGHFDEERPNESTLHIVAPSVPLNVVSPATSPLHSPSTSPGGQLQVTLDLTIPPTSPQLPPMTTSRSTNSSGSTVISSNCNDIQQTHQHNILMEDPDILAGCRALLCFSHGLNRLTA